MLIRHDYKPYMAKQQAAPPAAVQNSSRLLWLMGIIAAGFGVLVYHSFNVQAANKDQLSKFGENRVLRSIKEPALRGSITDRNGTVLAVSRYTKVPTFNPSQIYKPKRQGDPVNWNVISDEQFVKMAQIMQLPEGEIRAKLQNTSSKYVNFKIELSLEQADALQALKIPGLRFEERSERLYPTGNLFAHVVGFTDKKGVGLEGLEHTQNKLLQGEDGKQMVLRDSRQNIIEMIDSPENIPAKSGQTLVLSFDQHIQRLAYQELAKALKQFKAKAGGVVVLDAKTGEILAMSSLPDYDANMYGEFPQESYSNFAVAATLEPGSIIKPFLVAKAIDDRKINANTWFDTQPFAIGSKMIKDTHLYRSLNAQGILQKSSNVGMAKIANLYDNKSIYDFYAAVGLGKKTGSGISGEQNLPLKRPEKWGKLDKAVMSYGYAVSANLLQMAQGYTVFTADGKLMPATVFKQTAAPEGRQVISPETAREVRRMMVSVTEPGGTGTSGAVPGYDVGGKTGTARKADGGSYSGKYRASFVGFAPAANPRLIVAVTIDEPDGSIYGGTVAGPVFREVMAGSLKILGVKPTKAIVPSEIASKS